MLVGGVLGEGRRTSSLQKGRLADIALDIHGLLVDFELRLGDLDVLVFAVALRCCLGSVSHFDC